MRELRLKKGEDRRLRRGHLWVYSNEIADDLKQFQPGEAVTVLDSQDRPIGSGTINPHNLIAVRIHAKRGEEDLDRAFLQRKIANASRLRERLGFGNVARIVHGESDGLPGLIIDRFEDTFAVQHNSVGMDLRRESILEVLDELFEPKCVIAADDSHSREMEGLPLQRGVAGEYESEVIWYTLDGLEFPLNVTSGQKTGGYLDQVYARKFVGGLAKDARVLDAFCYTGGFGMYAAQAGAREVVLADSSESALELAVEAFKRNKLPDPVVFKEDLLKSKLKANDLGGQFDLTIIDPPPLIKNKSKLSSGLSRYESLFSTTYSWTKPEGLAAIFTCSHHMQHKDLLDRTKRAQWKAYRRVRKLAEFGAGMDHPVLASHPETEYLHGVLLEVG